MKIEFVNEKIIIYLYKNKLLIDNIDLLNKQIKEFFINLIKKYHLDFWGFSKVNIYHNNLYGSILEIEKIYNSEYNIGIIDLKIVLNKDVDFYLEINDSIYLDNINYIIKNNKFYVNINKLDNLYKYIEHGKIVYKII